MGIPNVFGKLWVLILDSGRECQVNKHFLKPTFGNFLPPYIHLYFRIVYNDVVGILYHFTDNDPRAVIG